MTILWCLLILVKMKQNKFGQLIFSESDVCSLLMQGHPIDSLKHVVVEDSVDLEQLTKHIEHPDSLLTWTFPYNAETSVEEFHAEQQANWHMPEEYKTLDIAQHVLSLCRTEAELQRCGQELLLYQGRDLFDLLRYLTYLVSVMKQNRVIWGVGRGSSVASYVLYLLGVHRIDSMYYDLDPQEFLR
jgi:Bacterial DNA polymerase III alpha NTPase domain